MYIHFRTLLVCLKRHLIINNKNKIVLRIMVKKITCNVPEYINSIIYSGGDAPLSIYTSYSNMNSYNICFIIYHTSMCIL